MTHHQVFLSYAREDRPTATKLAAYLERHGVSVWWDGLIDPGSHYHEQTREALEHAVVVVVLWSNASIGSTWVRAEADVGFQKRSLLPIYLQDVQAPPPFSMVQGILLHGLSEDERRQAAEQVLGSLRNMLNVPSNGPPPISYSWLPSARPGHKRSRWMFATGAAVAAALALWFAGADRPGDGQPAAAAARAVPGDVDTPSTQEDRQHVPVAMEKVAAAATVVETPKPVCGDGTQNGAEACDDGNRWSGDGCSRKCTIEHAVWTEVTAQPAPPARHNATLAYDPGLKALLLLHGTRYDFVAPARCSDDELNKVWLWNANRWTPRANHGLDPCPTSGSGETLENFYAPAGTYDAARDQLVYFGAKTFLMGSDFRWSAPALDPQPSPRTSHGMTYDPLRKVVVMTGGREQCEWADACDHWEWDGRTWKLRAKKAAFGRRFRYHLIYDEARRAPVLFGGILGVRDAESCLSDLWQFDGNKWSELPPNGPTPPGRAAPAMFYHPVRKSIIVFGGRCSEHLSDIWEYRDDSWSELEVAGSAPPPRFGSQMAYYPPGGYAVLFGGTVEATGRPPKDSSRSWKLEWQ